LKLFGRDSKKIKNSESVSLADSSFLDMLDVDVKNIVNPKNIGEITFYTCLKTLSDKMASIPIGVYSSVDGIASKYENHYLNYLLQVKPNVYQNAPIFWSDVERDRNYWGNAFVYPEVIGGKIKSLWHMPAEEMQIFIDDAGLFGTANSLWYIWTDYRTGIQHKFSSTQVLHFKNWLTLRDGIIGRCVKDVLNSYIDTSQQGNYYVNNLVHNGMISDHIILQYTGDLKDSAKMALVKNVESYSKTNSTKYIPLPLGIEAKNLASKLVDSQFFDLTKYTALQIASAFGVPPSYLNNLDKANYANVGVLQDALYRDTLLPIIAQYEAEMTGKLFTPKEKANGFYFYYNVDVILRASITERASAYSTMINNSIMTPNEVRNKENLAPKDGGDELLGQGANTTLTNIINGINYTTKGGV
jgi:HK97 family phage portal protein